MSDDVLQRPLPLEAVMLLGLHANEPGFVQFLVGCRDDGFALSSPEDEALSDDEWREVVTTHVRTLVGAWGIYQECMTAPADLSRNQGETK